MNFQRGRAKEDPEINLIPLIDVLLVILIFLMITTTYSKFAELQINLPTADVEKQLERPNEVNVMVSMDGRYLINRIPYLFKNVDDLALGAQGRRRDAQKRRRAHQRHELPDAAAAWSQRWSHGL